MIKTETTRLQYLIECRNTQSGQVVYFVTCRAGKFRFTKWESLQDFIHSNDFGYVE